MAIGPFAAHLSPATQGMESPAYQAFDITPNDSADLAIYTRGLWVGTAGNVRLIAAGSSTAVTVQNVPAGTLLPIQAKRVLATLTTAGGFIGLT